ncbi:PAS domain-containing protein, partial [Halorhodospira sp. 9621]|uniref:PAS domain-containing protein n=1 Tax=Halorhodospira sp. 9621 TaxID=2899135 RepID=UPI001EE7B3D3|nr:PAS domain-containing protein [Halorhodospira sp. 9621]
MDKLREQAPEDGPSDAQTQLSLLREALGAGFWRLDLASGRATADAQLLALYGRPGTEASADHAPRTEALWREHVHPEDWARVEACYCKAFDHHAPWDLTFRIQRPDGDIRHLRSVGQMECDAAGTPTHVLAVEYDVTEPVSHSWPPPQTPQSSEVAPGSGERADLPEESIQQQRLLMAQQAAGFGVWDWDVEADRAIWDAACWRMLGFDPEQQGALTYAQWQALVHPQDLERILPVFERHLADGSPFTIEFRYRCADGSWLWVQNRGQTLRRAADGSPGYMVGTHVDIQQTKEAERALAESERRLRDVALAAGEYIWEIDQQGHYTFITSPAEPLLGRPVEAIIGHSPFDFMPDDEAERVRGLLKAWADEKSSWQGLEHASLRPDGSLVYQRISGLPILDEEGHLTGFRGTGRDITAEKDTQRRQEELSQRLHLATSAANIGIWDYDLTTD